MMTNYTPRYQSATEQEKLLQYSKKVLADAEAMPGGIIAEAKEAAISYAQKNGGTFNQEKFLNDAYNLPFG